MAKVKAQLRTNLKGLKKIDMKSIIKSVYKAFASLIDKVSGKGTWDANPWAVVYYYKLIK